MTQTDNDALVPCPFCGGAATVTTPLDFGNIRAIECTDSKCGAVGPWRSYENAAVVAWNTRAALRSPAPMVDGEKLGRFGHHPEADIDYDCEIEALIGMAYDRLTGMREQPDLEERIRKAMEFRVMETPLELRWLSQKFNGTREIYTKMPDCIARLEATRPQPAQDEESDALVDLIREWLLSTDHPVSQWERNFAAAITGLRQHGGESALREALIDETASLAAACSLLERAGKVAKKGAPSDLMFNQMLRDYQASLARARAALGGDGEA